MFFKRLLRLSRSLKVWEGKFECNLPYLQAHCQSPTSQCYSQNIVKELARKENILVFAGFTDQMGYLQSFNGKASFDKCTFIFLAIYNRG